MICSRRKTRPVRVGPYTLGGKYPVRVQSMCNTDTRDVHSTLAQLRELEDAGCEIARLAVPDAEAAAAFGAIRRRTKLPIVADIHFDYRLALAAIEGGADKIRINPGNIGGAREVAAVAKACKARGIAVRIGVNAGSVAVLKKVSGKPRWTCAQWARLMAKDALAQAAQLEEAGLEDIVVSLKADDMERTVLANEIFAAKSDIPLHIGVTEAGSLIPGVVKSSLALGQLLMRGIGDTIRVSLTEDPALQVRCAYEILKSLGLRGYGPEIISCPTCGRCRADVAAVVKRLEKEIYSDRALCARATGLKIAVMGCAVNGPGEARDADFGIAGGDGEGLWFEKGRAVKKIPQTRWVAAIIGGINKSKKAV